MHKEGEQMSEEYALQIINAVRHAADVMEKTDFSEAPIPEALKGRLFSDLTEEERLLFASAISDFVMKKAFPGWRQDEQTSDKP
jgi:hypothetical protein